MSDNFKAKYYKMRTREYKRNYYRRNRVKILERLRQRREAAMATKVTPPVQEDPITNVSELKSQLKTAIAERDAARLLLNELLRANGKAA